MRAFRSIVRFAVEKGGHGEITDETTLIMNLRGMAGVSGIDEKLLFDPAAYRCHYQVSSVNTKQDSYGARQAKFVSKPLSRHACSSTKK